MGKLDVKPFIDIAVKDSIYKISHVTGYSVKGICEDLCNHVFENGLGIELSPYFKRDITIDGVEFKGNRKAEKFDPISENSERISLLINETAYEYAYNLSYAVGCSLAKIVGYAVEKCMRDFEFLNNYINQYLSKILGKEQVELVSRIIDTTDEEYGDVLLLLYIADEYRRFSEGVEGVIEDAVTS